MSIRLQTETIEATSLSQYAALSKHTKGRMDKEGPCDIRTDYQRDRDRIIHSKAFRRLKHKTQVFIAPEGDHYRTRLTHTLEVAQISRTLAKALRLNEDLTEAIALGHDLGHTPFGHTGEHVLHDLHPGGFKHNEHSLRVVDELESRKGKKGLNLTYEVREGILHHTGPDTPETLEGQIVKISDRIAYINHDIDDAIRAEVLTHDDLPKDCMAVLGKSHGERINTMIQDIILNSIEKPSIEMSETIGYHMQKLRQFMFENVYYNKNAKKEEGKATYILEQLYQHYMEYFDHIPQPYQSTEFLKEDVVCYYIAGMTDRYAIKVFKELFVPSPWD